MCFLVGTHHLHFPFPAGNEMIMKVNVVIDLIHYPNYCLTLLVLVDIVLGLWRPERTCAHKQGKKVVIKQTHTHSWSKNPEYYYHYHNINSI